MEALRGIMLVKISINAHCCDQLIVKRNERAACVRQLNGSDDDNIGNRSRAPAAE